MAGFRKASPEQGALKIGMFGRAGSGKTFTALLVAEGLAAHTGKRVAFVDTERGTDFYAREVKERSVHPQAFDFDVLHSKSLDEVTKSLQQLNPQDYGVVVIDSISHLWQAAMDSYSGTRTRADTIPFHAWGKIKKPYKALVEWLMNTQMHVLICGREATVWETSEETGEMRAVGVKMKAEGETPYEPNILLNLECVRSGKRGEGIITAFAEKDRTGVLAGRVIEWPNFESIAAPILGILGDKQGALPSGDDAASHDAEAQERQDAEREARSKQLLKRFSALFELAPTPGQVKAEGTKVTPDVKKQMTRADVTALGAKWREEMERAEREVAAKAPVIREITEVAEQGDMNDGELAAFVIKLFPEAKLAKEPLPCLDENQLAIVLEKIRAEVLTPKQ